jgi:hypothetical protein
MRFTVEAAAALSLPLGFTVPQLSRALMVPDAGAVVRYARLCGAIERIGRGRYRSRLDPELAQRWKEAADHAREAALSLPDAFPGALDGASAVFVWTRGGYVAGWTDWRMVIEVRVPVRWEDEAVRQLRAADIGVCRAYPSANELGVFARLMTSKSVRRTIVGGVPVITKGAVLKLIRANPGAFAGAAELIEDGGGEVEVLR